MKDYGINKLVKEKAFKGINNKQYIIFQFV